MNNWIITLALTVGTFFGVQAQSKSETVKIKTSAECHTCEEIMESKLNYVKGISYADLDVKTKVLEIKYNPKKITLEQIKAEISHLGYDADEVAAQPDKRNSLPKCCQPGGMN